MLAQGQRELAVVEQFRDTGDEHHAATPAGRSAVHWRRSHAHTAPAASTTISPVQNSTRLCRCHGEGVMGGTPGPVPVAAVPSRRGAGCLPLRAGLGVVEADLRRQRLDARLREPIPRFRRRVERDQPGWRGDPPHLGHHRRPRRRARVIFELLPPAFRPRPIGPDDAPHDPALVQDNLHLREVPARIVHGHHEQPLVLAHAFDDLGTPVQNETQRRGHEVNHADHPRTIGLMETRPHRVINREGQPVGLATHGDRGRRHYAVPRARGEINAHALFVRAVGIGVDRLDDAAARHCSIKKSEQLLTLRLVWETGPQEQECKRLQDHGLSSLVSRRAPPGAGTC